MIHRALACLVIHRLADATERRAMAMARATVAVAVAPKAPDKPPGANLARDH